MKNEDNAESRPIKLFMVSLGSCLHEPRRGQTNWVRETRTGAQEYRGAKKHAKEIMEFVLQVENICACACKELEEEYTTLKNTKA